MRRMLTLSKRHLDVAKVAMLARQMRDKVALNKAWRYVVQVQRATNVGDFRGEI